MIKLFRDLLIDMNNTTARPDVKIFKQKSERLFDLISNDQFLKAIPMSQSVHVHGVSFIKYFKYPIGSLSESANLSQEQSQHTARVGHAR